MAMKMAGCTALAVTPVPSSSSARSMVINRAEDVSGFQLGFVNLAQHMYGIQIGLVNIVQSKTSSSFLPIVNWSF